jgi:hypothetical protein
MAELSISVNERAENAEDILREVLGKDHVEKITRTITSPIGIRLAASAMYLGTGKLIEMVAHNSLTPEALTAIITRCDNDREFRCEVAAVALFAALKIYDEGIANHLRR